MGRPCSSGAGFPDKARLSGHRPENLSRSPEHRTLSGHGGADSQKDCRGRDRRYPARCLPDAEEKRHQGGHCLRGRYAGARRNVARGPQEVAFRTEGAWRAAVRHLRGGRARTNPNRAHAIAGEARPSSGRLSLHAHHLFQRVHHIDQIDLVRHYTIDVLVGAGNLIDHALVLATDHPLGLTD